MLTVYIPKNDITDAMREGKEDLLDSTFDAINNVLRNGGKLVILETCVNDEPRPIREVQSGEDLKNFQKELKENLHVLRKMQDAR